MSKKKKKQKQQAKRKQRQRKKQARSLFYTVLAVVVIGAVLWGGYELLKSHDEAQAGTRVADQGRGHTPGCRTGNYNTTPPTSGCHAPTTAPWGVSQTQVPDEIQLHNLEHGGIMIQYRPNPVAGLGDDYLQSLEAYVREMRQQDRYCKLLLAPYEGLQEPIALTAWNWILTLEEFDQALITQFINDHIEQGPERGIPCR